METRNIIDKFITQYHSNDNVLGIIFYGSANYKTDTPQSDIDLLFITDDNCNYKGTIYVEDKKIEYFEKNIYYLMEKIENLHLDSDRSLISIFKNGSVIYSKNGTIEYLQEEILANQKYFSSKRKYQSNNSDLIDLKMYIESLNLNNHFFQYIYYNLLESIRKKYHEEKGYSKLPSMKIYQLYSNPKYAKNFYCVTLPDQQFIDLYLDLLTNGYQEEKLKKLYSLINCDATYSKEIYIRYTKLELKYLSTIINNMLDKTSYYLEINHSTCYSNYYITLEKIRKLYCYKNQLDSRFNLNNSEYDAKFFELFNLCINDRCIENLNELFNYVVQDLKMDYKNYKILELTH